MTDSTKLDTAMSESTAAESTAAESTAADLTTRRRFLGQASCSAVGATALFSSLLNLRAAGALATPTTDSAFVPRPGVPLPGDDYKALVCLFLAGGNDSFNMLVPRGPEEYAGVCRHPRRPRIARREPAADHPCDQVMAERSASTRACPR